MTIDQLHRGNELMNEIRDIEREIKIANILVKDLAIESVIESLQKQLDELNYQFYHL